jgi:quinol monooxygenase YgiN
MLIPPQNKNEVLEILGSMTEQIQFETGCISCRLYRGVKDQAAILLEEIWTNDVDLQRHLQSEIYRRILLVIEMSAKPPEIRFDTIAYSSGFETIEKTRNQSREW